MFFLENSFRLHFYCTFFPTFIILLLQQCTHIKPLTSLKWIAFNINAKFRVLSTEASKTYEFSWSLLSRCILDVIFYYKKRVCYQIACISSFSLLCHFLLNLKRADDKQIISWLQLRNKTKSITNKNILLSYFRDSS